VAFDQLKSDESQAHLSVCRPVSAFQNGTVKEGVPRYSPLGNRGVVHEPSCHAGAPWTAQACARTALGHITGDVLFRRRSSRTLCSMIAGRTPHNYTQPGHVRSKGSCGNCLCLAPSSPGQDGICPEPPQWRYKPEHHAGRASRSARGTYLVPRA